MQISAVWSDYVVFVGYSKPKFRAVHGTMLFPVIFLSEWNNFLSFLKLKRQNESKSTYAKNTDHFLLNKDHIDSIPKFVMLWYQFRNFRCSTLMFHF